MSRQPYFLPVFAPPKKPQPKVSEDVNFGMGGFRNVSKYYNFVRQAGAHFYLRGNRFRFIGGNNYPLVHSSPRYTKAELDSFFACCVRDNVKVIRCFCHNRTPNGGNVTGNFKYRSGVTIIRIEAQYVQLDLVLDRARAYGIKIILSMSNEYPQFNDDSVKQVYCADNNAIFGTSYDSNNYGDNFHVDTNIIAQFKADIASFVLRQNTINGLYYYNDDTIFSWELGNELRYNSGTDTNVNTINSARLAIMTAWMNNISTYIRSIDPNHLIGSGSISQFWDYVNNDPIHNGSFYGLDYLIQHNLPNINYFDFHMYAYNDSPDFTLKSYGVAQGATVSASAAGLRLQFTEFCQKAHVSKKPIVIGEWGVDKRNTNTLLYSAYPRDTHATTLFADLFDDFGRDLDGFIFWHYTNLFDDNNYNIKPDGPHTAGNANSNLNDDDTLLRGVMRNRAAKL